MNSLRVKLQPNNIKKIKLELKNIRKTNTCI